jgi:Tfp pilus assembly protein PilV
MNTVHRTDDAGRNRAGRGQWPRCGSGHGWRHDFNLIEVVLALAVIAFGVVSVLALLPASLKANRDSVSDTHAAEVGQHLVETLAASMEKACDTSSWAATALVLPTGKPGTTEPDQGWTKWLSQVGVSFWHAGAAGEFQRVDMRRADADYSEFSAICRVWRQPVSISQLVDGNWMTRVLPWTDAIALNVEVSWPAQAPYAGRPKALYAMNVFRKAE